MIDQSPVTVSAVMECLRGIEDPEIGTDIVELGLIYRVEISEDASIRLVMTTTTRACPASAFIVEAVRARLQAIDRVGEVSVELVYEPPWSPDMIGRTVS